MNKNILRTIIRDVAAKRLVPVEGNRYTEYKLLQNHPELIPVLNDLMTPDFPSFVKDIEWLSPKPATYKVILENGQFFYLSDLERSWVAQISSKKHYLLSLGEETMASNAISRLLKITMPAGEGDEVIGDDAPIADMEAEEEVEDIPTGDELPDEITAA
jgi:hypothetical protein|tara:strand:- start:205 stop:681 length:477 start_codon:yes stop_codon:yes gene_type:complete